MMPPEMCAMPEVMTVISSDSVIRGRNGRIVSGASVCPMKMLAATFSDSAPEAFITRRIITANNRTIDLHDAEVIEDGEKRGDEDDRRQHLKGEHDAVAGALGPEHRRHDARPDLLVAERPEHEARADEGKIEQPIDGRAEPLKDRLADRGLQHEQREDHLQRKAPGDGAPIDGTPVRRQGVGHRHDDDQADERLQPGHTAKLGDERADRGAGGSGPEDHQVSRIVGHALQRGALGGAVCIGHFDDFDSGPVQGSRFTVHAVACQPPHTRSTTIGCVTGATSPNLHGLLSGVLAPPRDHGRHGGESPGPRSPARTSMPGGASTVIPTPWSMTSSSRPRPAPSATAARPTLSASSPVDESAPRRRHDLDVGR